MLDSDDDEYICAGHGTGDDHPSRVPAAAEQLIKQRVRACTGTNEVVQPGMRRKVQCACGARPPHRFACSDLRDELGKSSHWGMGTHELEAFAHMTAQALGVANEKGKHSGGRVAKLSGRAVGGYPIVGFTITPRENDHGGGSCGRTTTITALGSASTSSSALDEGRRDEQRLNGAAALAQQPAAIAAAPLNAHAAVDSGRAIDASDMSCCICHELLCYPLSLPCGHSFCGACLLECNTRPDSNASGCPECRAPFLPTPPAPNVHLQRLAESLHAGERPESEAYADWESRKSSWKEVQPVLHDLWTATPMESVGDGGGAEAPSRARARRRAAPARAGAVVAPNASAAAAAREARQATRNRARDQRERDAGQDDRHDAHQ